MSGGFDAELIVRVGQHYAAYARAVDGCDLAALRELARSDVVLERSNGVARGMDAFLDVYRAHLDSDVEGTRHVVTNIQAWREPGDLVGATAYFQAIYFDTGGTRVLYGRYHDVLGDAGGALLLVRRRVEVERLVRLPASSTDRSGVDVPPAGVRRRSEQ